MLAAIRTAIVVLGAVVAFGSNAALIIYEFTVTATSGPLIGATSTGTFAFDSASITPGASNRAAGLLIDLDFTWNGISYDESSANTGSLAFDGAGELTDAVFGNFCFPGVCIVAGGSEHWFVDGAGLVYSVGGVIEVGFGPITRSRVNVVSEPASLALVGLALVIGVAVRRAKRNA